MVTRSWLVFAHVRWSWMSLGKIGRFWTAAIVVTLFITVSTTTEIFTDFVSTGGNANRFHLSNGVCPSASILAFEPSDL